MGMIHSTKCHKTRYLVGLEFPESNIDGDTTFTFGLEFVQNPSVFEGTFTHFLGFLLELFNSSLIDTTALVDQMPSGGRFTRVDMTNDNDVDMSLFFTHVGTLKKFHCIFMQSKFKKMLQQK